MEEQLRSGVGQLPQQSVQDMVLRQMGIPSPTDQSMNENQMLDMMMRGADRPAVIPGAQQRILEMMGASGDDELGGGEVDDTLATEPVVQQPAVRGYYNNEQQLYPNYASGTFGPSAAGDPEYEAAMQAWMEANQREPATDGDFAEIESMMTSGDVSRNATEQEVLRTVTGTRGNQGANANGDDENLPDSDTDPRWQAAIEAFIRKYGREPATDSDMEKVEGIMEEAQ
jgi:hypothetical protein